MTMTIAIFIFQHWENGVGPTEESPYPLPAISLGNTPSQKRPSDDAPLTSKGRKRLDTSEHLLHKEREVAQVLKEMSETAQPSTSQDTVSQPCSSITPHIKCGSCGNGVMISESTHAQIVRENFRKEVTKNDKNCFRYTGVPTIAALMCLFEWLEPFAVFPLISERYGTTVQRKLSLFEEFLLTLIRIRKGYDTQHMGFLFGISQSHVRQIFDAWIKFLNKCFTPLIIWPKREIVEANLPDSFKNCPRTRCIIGCTEYLVEKPVRSMTHMQTWVKHKHSNTFKQLVGISPNGAFTFLSNLYIGSTSDLNIFKKCNFLDKVEEGDDIMADQGFNISHLLSEKQATLNIPTLAHGQNLSQSRKAVNRSKKIARVRIVERAIRRLKTFKILSGVIPRSLLGTMDELVTICAVLCNLQPTLPR